MEVAVIAAFGGGELEDTIVRVVFAAVFIDEIAKRGPKFGAEFGGVEDFHIAPEHDAMETFIEIKGGFGVFAPKFGAEGAVVGGKVEGAWRFKVFFVPIHGFD